MSVVKRFLRGEVTLWKSFWLVSAQPFLIVISELLYHFFVPREIYPNAYTYYSIIVRLSCVIFYLLVFVALVHGTWKSSSKYEASIIWKWLARLVLILNALYLCLGLFMNSMELSNISPKYFPYELETPH
jgi:hypothetical protein